ncbi:hypothetical protein F383_31104 [Gossypium arboreum]|uniref:Uncharacterized protein n=1 Tax=Gossypium arboreum TaxID=29729 RepID=A0A0B0PN55_GOSAR|nr:hypothetical protein F383_31104 [Gossypium arboreum]
MGRCHCTHFSSYPRILFDSVRFNRHTKK